MITLSKVKSVIIEAAERIVKIRQYGAKTAVQASSSGDDSSPIENATAIYADTGENGEPVIIGYINKNQLAEPGEKRLFSVDANGNLQTYIWIRNDGIIELAGDNDNIVRHQALDTSLQTMVTGINAELIKIQTAITGLGGVYARVNVTLDISTSEVTEVRTT